MGKRANPAVVGGFVVGAVVLTVVAVAAFGSGRLFRDTVPYVLYFSGDVNGLNVGAPVKFKGVRVGEVKRILLNLGTGSGAERGFDDVRIPVIIELDQDLILDRGGAAASDLRAAVQVLIENGLRGQLAMESFVTGLLYVRLDLFPGRAARRVKDSSVALEEIPTVPTPLEEVQNKAAQVLAKLEDVQIAPIIDSLGAAIEGLERLVNAESLREAIDSLPAAVDELKAVGVSAQETLDGIRRLSDNVNDQVAPLVSSMQRAAGDAGATLRTAGETLESVRSVVAPESPVLYELSRAMVDLGAAARAIRRLAEDLERNPAMLVRGRAVEVEP